MQKAIKTINTKKAPDADGITIEHIKNAGIIMTGALTQLINVILQRKTIPARLKLGILTLVWKKNCKKQPTNYRGITVISVNGKLIETVLRNITTPILRAKQNNFQRGFTKGTSPLNAVLIMHETIMDAKSRKKTRYIAFLDAKSAFDVVSYESLLRKLFLSGVQGPVWSIIADTFEGANSVVKWEGNLSPAFEIKQGV
jgi:hypothetical protein